MTTILAFDTSGPHCAVAVMVNDAIVASHQTAMKKGQAERLMPLISQVMASQGMVWEELDAIGVGIGPGNFTGVRIAVSAARGAALALGIPAIGVSTFDAGCQRAGIAGRIIVGHNGVRDSNTFQPFADGVAIAPPVTDPDLATARQWQADRLVYFGDRDTGLSLSVDFGAEGISINALSLLHVPDHAGIAADIAAVAANRLRADPGHAAPAPLYLRPADAAPARDSGPVILT